MTLNEIEQRLDALQAEKDKLTAELERLKAEEAQETQVKPWRAEHGENYYHITPCGNVLVDVEIFHLVDDNLFNYGNYYRTEALAEQDAKELALRGRVRQLRDALCEGYKFVSGKNNFYLFINEIQGRYSVSDITRCPSIGEIYFDTREHAQQACDILNAEMRKESGGNG